MKINTLFGKLTPAQFMRDYWHKKPLLIRQAFPNFKPFLSRTELFELAAQDQVESRLISNFDQQWKMSTGPIRKTPSLKKNGWSLLVQGVNLHNDAADDLLRQFDFLPNTRLDDLMISYASDQGGVGPHFDSYDVFLLQAHGQRRWRIGAQKNLDLIPGMPLKILKNFQPEEEYVLEPGDMLYLPPQYAHDGVAIGECMTYSVGFRAPSFQELGEAFLQFMADSIDLPGRYADPDLRVTKNAGEISSAMLQQVSDQLRKVEFTNDDMVIFLGEYLSEPKASVTFDVPSKPVTFPRFTQMAAKRGLRLSRKSNMLYRGKHIFINGESFSVQEKDRVTLHCLANARKISGEMVAQASEDVMEAFHIWYEDGWLVF